MDKHTCVIYDVYHLDMYASEDGTGFLRHKLSLTSAKSGHRQFKGE